jgi:TRAP-type C4-dicarboxylate transport system permease small subunit
MRKLLDNIYLAAAVIAGVSLVLMTLLILAQIVGRWFDVLVPSTEDFSGFLLAAASFLALPYALRYGSLIRVSLFISNLSQRWRKPVEILVLLIAIGFAAYAAWSVGLMVLESYDFEELTQGYIAVPLWMPQLPIMLGLALFTLSLVDELVSLMRTGKTSYQQHEDEQQNEE